MKYLCFVYLDEKRLNEGCVEVRPIRPIRETVAAQAQSRTA